MVYGLKSPLQKEVKKIKIHPEQQRRLDMVARVEELTVQRGLPPAALDVLGLTVFYHDQLELLRQYRAVVNEVSDTLGSTLTASKAYVQSALRNRKRKECAAV